MRSSKKIAVVVLALLLLAGCNSMHQLINSNNTIEKQGQQIAVLQKNVSLLTQELKRVRKANNQIASTIGDITLRHWERVNAYLTPGQSGYSLVFSNLGPLAVYISNVRPYANGSKVSLTFGNPLAADISGLKVTLQWGKVGEIIDTKSTKQKTFAFSNSLLSGSWTTVHVVLQGIPADKLGFVFVKDVSETGISLSR